MVRKNRAVFSAYLSVVPRRVMLLWRVVFVGRTRRRGFGYQVPGGAFFVEVAQVVGNAFLGLGHRLVRMSVDLFLFEAAP